MRLRQFTFGMISSYPESSWWSWRAAPTPSQAAGTRPCSSSEPNTASGSPPAVPQYVSGPPPSPAAFVTTRQEKKTDHNQAVWTDDKLVIFIVCPLRFYLLHVMHAGLEQQAVLFQLVDLIRSRPPAFQLVLQHLFGLLKHPVVLLQLLKHRQIKGQMIIYFFCTADLKVLNPV